MPLISVIIPVYNGEKTIRETILSVLEQSFSDFEIIVINDGSQDQTLAVVSNIQDQRLKVFSHPNAGLAASRNRGISLAVGEYISFIDADDLWTQDKLEAQLNALLFNSQAAVAYSWTDWIDDNGQFLRPGGYVTANGNVYAKLLIRDFVESGSNPLIRSYALAKVGDFDVSLPAVEDWDMWLRLAAHYDFVAVPSPQILYRVSPHSMSSDVWKMEAASLQVIERAFSHAPTQIQNLRRQTLGSRYQYLTIKALAGVPEQRKGLAAARFFWQAIYHDPGWLRQTKLMLIILFKIAVTALFPSLYAQALLMLFKSGNRKQNQLAQSK